MKQILFIILALVLFAGCGETKKPETPEKKETVKEPLAKEEKEEPEYDGKKLSEWIMQLNNNNAHIRDDAVAALCFIGDKSAVPVLIKALEDEAEFVRSHTAEALGEIGDKTAVSALIQALSDKNIDVRLNAEEALKKLTGQDFDPDPAKWRAWWDENKDKILKEEKSTTKKPEKK